MTIGEISQRHGGITVAAFVVLLVGLCALGAADTVVAPGGVDLSCSRLQATQAGALSLSYINSVTGYKITVMADIGTGTPVANALLSIKGGDIGSYASLIVGSDPVATRTLRSNVPAETGVIDDIYLKLDASGVAAGAANLGTAWTYTLTYTLGP